MTFAVQRLQLCLMTIQASLGSPLNSALESNSY